jgi:hypothetical protein
MVMLRLGDYRAVLADVEVDSVIADPPYGAQTHEGHDAIDEGLERAGLGYRPWTEADVEGFVDFWAPRTRGWMACMTSDDFTQVWRRAYRAAGRLDFAPVPVLQHRPRLQGDGPGSGAVYLMVARPRSSAWASWGSLPCWYTSTTARGKDAVVVGAKPLALMKRIVRNYSRKGDVVCDPCAGGGTTLLAAVQLGRQAIGAELDPLTHMRARRRLARETRTTRRAA